MGKIAPVFQIAWVTRDMDAMEDVLTRQFGVKKWVRTTGFVTDPTQTFYRGKPVKFSADVSLSYSGDLQLEIITPGSGDANPYDDFLNTSGPGLHHTCIEVADIEAALDGYNKAGLETVFRLDVPGMGSYAYVKGAAAGSSLLELAQMSPEMSAHMAALKADCS